MNDRLDPRGRHPHEKKHRASRIRHASFGALAVAVAACSGGGTTDGVDATGIMPGGPGMAMPTGNATGAPAGTGGGTGVGSQPGAAGAAMQPTVAPGQVVGEGNVTVDCTTLARPPTPLRRLTRFEYNNTVRDLFGVTTSPASAFPADEVADGFSNNALVLTVSALHAERYMDAAEAIAAQAVTNLATLVPCDAATTGEQACAQQFAETFGRRIYRRPLQAEDIAPLMEAYAAGATNGFAKGIEVMIRSMLQSPHFLFRIEFTGAQTPNAGMVRLDGYETATRLSYLLWGSTPDDALLDAAANGGLSTPEQVAAEARRMLADPKARVAITEFYRQWMELNRLDIISKDPAAFPLWSEDTRAAMQAEAAAVVERFVWGADASLTQLLTAPLGYASGPLAQIYGVAATDTVVDLPADQRSGVLTLPGFLAVQAHPDQTSPVLRGLFIRDKLLCDPVPPPPDDVAASPPEPTEGGTARERFSAHANTASCAACHQLMDPLGYPFETYDSVGTYRTTDAGRELDLSGEFVATDIDGPFNGVHEMAQRLATSRQVSNCVATQWYKFAMGRGDEAGDACSLSPLQEGFTATGTNLMELIVGITQTEAFLYRRAATGEVSQ